MRSFVAGLRMRQLALLMLCGLALACTAGSVEANSSWKSLQGHSECGGIDKNGELQEPCGFTRATKIGKALGKCPSGSFFDIGTWSCYACPTGFNRNARAVTSPKACDKAMTPKTSRATFEKKVQCPSGAFLDKRNGGECWTCPSGYSRTAAAVDKWNACGMIGKKAVGAIFKSKACTADNSFRDPRNGGECWSCPEDYSRTANAVTSASACKTALDFEPAVKEAALTCEADEIFDLIDGGTCWKCAEGETRTMNSVKGGKACRNKAMKWVVPTRTMYGLFGLGNGASDILAKAIADRTAIDAMVKKIAEGTGDNVQKAQAAAWAVIDSKPWNSPYLSILLQDTLMAALDKKEASRSDSEKNLIDTVSKMIQWNRQFIAYQSKQAYEAWVTTSSKFYAKKAKQMGAATIYADNMMTPPDYNELIVASIQAGSVLASPTSVIALTIFLKPASIALLPYRKAALKAAQAGAKIMTSTGGIPSASAMAAASGPILIAVAAAVIFTMEMDKLLKMEEYEGKIRQAVDISNRAVDLKTLFQQENGAADFSFHWASILAAKTEPSAYFKTRLAAYKGGTAGTSVTFPTINMNSATVAPDRTTADVVTADTVKIETIQTTSTVVGVTPTESQATVPTASKTLLAAIKRQTSQPEGGMRIELTSKPGLCLSKAPGSTVAMALADCGGRDTLWFTFEKKLGQMMFADKYCVRLSSASPESDSPIYLNECATDKAARWELTKRGLIKGIGSNNCVGVDRKKNVGAAVVSLTCSSASSRQIWRPWVPN